MALRMPQFFGNEGIEKPRRGLMGREFHRNGTWDPTGRYVEIV
jgi:hypothetical protein